MQNIPYIFYANINYILELLCWQLAVRIAFKFIMVAFEMSVRDSLCKASTKKWDRRKARMDESECERIWKKNAGN